jgi:hypothetical protein
MFTIPVMLWFALLIAAMQAQVVFSPKNVDAGSSGSNPSIPLDISRLYNNRGFAIGLGDANLDNLGNAYPAQHLPPQNIIYDGINFTFPQYNASVLATNTGIRILIPNTIRRIFESADFPGYSNTRIFPEYYSNTTCNITCSCQGAIIRVFLPLFLSTLAIIALLSAIVLSILVIDSSIASILSSNSLVLSILLSK